jgi:ClpP class serine protease
VAEQGAERWGIGTIFASAVRATGNEYAVVRRRYLAALSEVTTRNAIIYYSAWLHKAGVEGIPPTRLAINDRDKNAFMATIHRLDRSKGLDLVPHTPGGSVAAAESLVQYLHAMFGGNLRVIVPQLAMSAGTMIALAAREVLMGAHSSFGPDPFSACITSPSSRFPPHRR